MAGRFYVGAATALLSPQRGSHLFPPPLTHTLQPHRGDTMYLYSSTINNTVDGPCIRKYHRWLFDFLPIWLGRQVRSGTAHLRCKFSRIGMQTNKLGFCCGVAIVAACFFGGCFLSCGGNGVQVAPATKEPAVLSLTAVSPTSGPTSGGISVALQGTAFSNGVRVMFGSQVSTAVVVVSSTQIRAVTPPHSAGTVEVKVANSDLEKATLTSAFDYVPSPTSVLSLTAISPTAGPTSGGTSVTLQGTAFSDGVRVMFGSQVSTSVVVVSSTQIRAVTPPHSAGTVEIKVANSDLEKATLTSAFDYVPSPTLESVTPNSGLASGGTKVTIIGTNFSPGAKISFGNSDAREVTVVSSTVIQAVTPPQSPGIVDIKIETPDQLSFVMSRSFRFGQVLFADGFESGDFSAWSSAGKYSCSAYGSSFAVDSNRVHSGAKSAEFHYVIPSDQCSSSQDNNVVAIKTFDDSNGYANGLEHFFMRGYLYFKTPVNGQTGQGAQRKLIWCGDETDAGGGGGSWDIILTTFETTAGPPSTLGLAWLSQGSEGHGDSPVDWMPGTPHLNWDTWYSLEIEVQLNTPVADPGPFDGIFRVWLNGTMIWERTDAKINGNLSTPFTFFSIGRQTNRYNYQAIDEYRFWDDVIIADAYIGP